MSRWGLARIITLILLVSHLLVLAGCGGGDDPPGSASFTLSGTVAGLGAGGILVLNNGHDQLTVSANGPFAFAGRIAANGGFSVTIGAQPQGQVCTVSNGSGSGVVSNVANVTVTCSSATYAVAGSIAGLPAGTRVVIENNDADALVLSHDGPFRFITPVAHNGAYRVTVALQPAGATCTVSNGSGAGVTADVSHISIICSTDMHAIGGSVVGLVAGAQVTLHNNGADPLTLSANGAFSFGTPVAYRGSYSVTIGTQPLGQTCTVVHGSGSAVAQAVSNVVVSCSRTTYAVGGSVSGLLAGDQVTLLNNGADPMTISADGRFEFTVPVVHNGGYLVTVGTQAASRWCSVIGGTGAAGVAAGSVQVHCDVRTVVFNTVGAHVWTVPAGVTSVRIVATGAGGGGSGRYGAYDGHAGGAGAIVTSVRAVVPGQVLQLFVGGGGTDGQDGLGNTTAWECGTSGGGGGSTNVDAGTSAQVIAGGGGGGGACNNGTAGGSGAAGANGAGGDGFAMPSDVGAQGGHDGLGGTGGRGSTFWQLGATGGNGTGGAGGAGGQMLTQSGGAGGAGAGLGIGGSAVSGALGGGGGGGHGGGGNGTLTGSGGGASTTRGGDGSIAITLF